MSRPDWKWYRADGCKDPNKKPYGMNYWDPEAGRWYRRTPEEQEAWREARAKHPSRYHTGFSLRAKQRALTNYRMTERWDEIRRTVLHRDEYTCQMCGIMDTVLQVHHKEYPEKLGTESLDTLVTLCKACHHAIHYDENEKRRRDWKKFNPTTPTPNLPSPPQTPDDHESSD